MSNIDTSFRDAFTFNLRGAKTIGSFAAVPVIAHNRINEMLDARFRQLDDERSSGQVSRRRCA